MRFVVSYWARPYDIITVWPNNRIYITRFLSKNCVAVAPRAGKCYYFKVFELVAVHG